MMGMKLAFSLLQPEEAQMLKDMNTPETNMSLEATEPLAPAPKPVSTLTAPSTSAPKLPTIDANILDSHEPHALDPANKNLLPLENALVPYQPPTNDQDINFDLMEFIFDAKQDEDLVIAATQMEAEYNATKSTKTAVMAQRNSPKKSNVLTGCIISSIGTTNIHIHKNLNA